MEVQYLKYDGEDLPIRVGYRAMKKVKEENPDKDIEYDKEGNPIGTAEDNELLLYHSLTSGAYAVNKSLDIPYSKEDMEYILDECLIPFLKMVGEFTEIVAKEKGIDMAELKKVAPNRETRRAEEKKSKNKKQ